MVREEVDVNRDRQCPQRPQRRMPREPEIEQPPAARHERADRRIHEAREQRHATDPDQVRLGIEPLEIRADRAALSEPRTIIQLQRRIFFHFFLNSLI